MIRNYTENNAEEVVHLLRDLIDVNGSVNVVEIFTPGTPISEVSLVRNTTDVTKKYIVKVRE